MFLTAPGRHKRRSERWVRTIKERMCVIRASLPFKIPNTWNKFLLIVDDEALLFFVFEKIFFIPFIKNIFLIKHYNTYAIDFLT